MLYDFIYSLEQVMQIYMHRKLQPNQRMNQIIIVCNRQLVGRILFSSLEGIMAILHIISYTSASTFHNIYICVFSVLNDL